MFFAGRFRSPLARCRFFQVAPCLQLVISGLFFPVDTGRKLNVHKTFRKCPGRLLNVLCTFNLRPVSIGLFALGCFRSFQLVPYFSKYVNNVLLSNFLFCEFLYFHF